MGAGEEVVTDEAKTWLLAAVLVLYAIGRAPW